MSRHWDDSQPDVVQSEAKDLLVPVVQGEAKHAHLLVVQSEAKDLLYPLGR